MRDGVEVSRRELLRAGAALGASGLAYGTLGGRLVESAAARTSHCSAALGQPTPPRGTRGEFLTVDPLSATAGGIRGPVGLGFRVPCVVVSPWTRGGLVCSDTFDHTSVLRLIERRFGAEVPNLSAWRRATTGDLTGAFNFAAAPDYSIPKLPRTNATSALVTTGACKPQRTGQPAIQPYPVPGRIAMPRQQPGRPRRPSGLC
jgi:phospholipase C